MSLNLLDLMKGHLTDDVMGAASSFLGENAGATKTAMGAILPSVLGSMVSQAGTPSGASNLMSMLSSGGHDGSILNNLGGLLGGGSATQGLMDSGGGIINSLLGDKVGGIVNWIASFAGIKGSSATSLMSMAAPMIMGLIGKNLGSNGNATGLASMLMGQSSFIKNALPAGLGNVLGFADLGNTADNIKNTITNEVTETGNGMKKYLPWLLLAAAALAAIYFMKSCNNKPAEEVAVVAPVAEKENTATVVDDSISITLPSGDIIRAKKGSFLDGLNTEITDANADLTKALTFDAVNFASGSAVLTEDSKAQLDHLVTIMKAYTKVEVKVDGHTDNAGKADSNLKLSAARAESVKTYLGTHGIGGKRVATAGFGDTKPVGDNATDEGKAKNRRIECFVTKK
jgi:OmpA-OmpF porin, OOP family